MWSSIFFSLHFTDVFIGVNSIEDWIFFLPFSILLVVHQPNLHYLKNKFFREIKHCSVVNLSAKTALLDFYLLGLLLSLLTGNSVMKLFTNSIPSSVSIKLGLGVGLWIFFRTSFVIPWENLFFKGMPRPFSLKLSNTTEIDLYFLLIFLAHCIIFSKSKH